MRKEEWRPIKGFEGIYEVSSLGRVKSLARTISFGYGSSYKAKERIMSPHYVKGYRQVVLYKNRKRIYLQVHRLVAMAFIPNPNNYPIINHKNEIRSDNRPENLEWCSHSYNLSYNGNREKKGKARMRPILQYDKNGHFIAEYAGGVEAQRILGIDRKGISMAICGRLKTYKGYIWKKKM